MRERLKVIIERLLFLKDGERAGLLHAMTTLSDDDIQEMYDCFCGYEVREAGFLTFLFSRYPDLKNECENALQDVAQRAEVDEQITSALSQTNQFPSL